VSPRTGRKNATRLAQTVAPILDGIGSVIGHRTGRRLKEQALDMLEQVIAIDKNGD